MAINPDHSTPMTPPRRMSASVDCVGRGLTTPCIEEPVSNESNEQGLRQVLKTALYARFLLLRSSAFRIGIMFWLMFTACFGIAEYIFYETLQDRILNRVDETIAERFEAVSEVYDIGGLESVIKLAEARGQSPMASTMGFHLSTPNGERIAGNVPICITEMGWDDLTGEDLGLEDQGSYRFYTGKVGGNILSLGKSLEDLVELRRIAFICLVWTLVVSTLLALLGAVFCVLRTHKRIDGISTALNGVAAGNLNARLPVSCGYDDIDQLSIKINSSLERLKQTVDGMRQVSTDIAHDLKTPLNRLYITIEDAATKSRAGKCVGDDLDGALEEAQSINGTFEALLRIAQIEAGARKAQFKFFDLSSVLETAAEVYLPVVEENSQRLEVNLDAGKYLPMFGDQSLVLQLLVNLIENSVHHCNDGASIVLSAGEQNGNVWFSVADDGPGIPDAEREKVFRRLYRLERSRTTKGTGLGLSLVKAIADLHCGSISLTDNNPGLAVTVKFNRQCGSDSQPG